jgi:hypothetical protein
MQFLAVAAIQASGQHLAQRPCRSDRDCPLDTAGDRYLWHASGTADKRCCFYLTATGLSLAESEAVPGDHRVMDKSP